MENDSNRLEYRSGRDAAADDVQAMRRSFRTWLLLSGVWTIGLGVWVVYLALTGYVIFRFLL
jgi:hypothetical protein